MEIKQNLVPQSKYSLKSPHSMAPIGICVHNTANDASAKNEISYMVTNNLSTSFHIAVDDKEAWQGIPLNRNAWHARDGALGEGNRKYIGIEICYSKSGGAKFALAENNACVIIAQLLKERGWGVDRVKKHQDFSGKNCPHLTLSLGWDRFIKKIETALGGSMSDMYGTPHQYDLTNRESMKIAVDHLNEILEGKFVRVEEKKEIEEQLGREQEFSKRLVTNIEAIKAVLGLPKDTPLDTVVATVKSLKDSPTTPVNPNQPPKEIIIHGEKWALNGVEWSKDGLLGNYKRL